MADAMTRYSANRTRYRELLVQQMLAEATGDVEEFSRVTNALAVVSTERKIILDSMTTLQLRKINQGPRSFA